jgi:hypothetical protein
MVLNGKVALVLGAPRRGTKKKTSWPHSGHSCLKTLPYPPNPRFMGGK